MLGVWSLGGSWRCRDSALGDVRGIGVCRGTRSRAQACRCQVRATSPKAEPSTR